MTRAATFRAFERYLAIVVALAVQVAAVAVIGDVFAVAPRADAGLPPPSDAVARVAPAARGDRLMTLNVTLDIVSETAPAPSAQPEAAPIADAAPEAAEELAPAAPQTAEPTPEPKPDPTAAPRPMPALKASTFPSHAVTSARAIHRPRPEPAVLSRWRGPR